jgi:hypothetical protein
MALGLAQLLSAKGGVTFTTTGHTAVDVPACATGPDAGLFVGVQENTPDVARDVTELAFWRGHLTGTGGVQPHRPSGIHDADILALSARQARRRPLGQRRPGGGPPRPCRRRHLAACRCRRRRWDALQIAGRLLQPGLFS